MATKDQVKQQIKADLVSAGFDLTSKYQTVTPLVDSVVDNIVGTIFEYKEKVISFWNPSGGLPSNPIEGDRYIASGTGNGWINRNMYTRSGNAWVQTTYTPGLSIVYVSNEDKYYGAYSAGWAILGGSAPVLSDVDWRDVNGQIQCFRKVGTEWVEVTGFGFSYQ